MEKIKISKIKLNPNNPRIIKDEKFKKLVKSIEESPEMLSKRPIVCVTDNDGLIFPLGGNMRLKALQELKFKEIPKDWITMADEWSEEKRNEFLIKDNVGYGEWDFDLIHENWDIQQLEDWGLDVPEIKSEISSEDLSKKIESLYKIEISCKDEQEQEDIYNKLIEEGLECRVLTL